jgi:hypothetical protein
MTQSFLNYHSIGELVIEKQLVRLTARNAAYYYIIEHTNTLINGNRR